jgi:hypothetical protein
MEGKSDQDEEYRSILRSAINGDPTSMYMIGERQKDYRDQYAWFVVCKERIVAAPKPHSIKMNRTEFEADTAIKFFNEQFSRDEKDEAKKRVEEVRNSILKH